jgi:hypothetical protein
VFHFLRIREWTCDWFRVRTPSVGVPCLFICVASSQCVRFSYSILSISMPCLDAFVCAKTVHCVSMICVDEKSFEWNLCWSDCWFTFGTKPTYHTCQSKNSNSSLCMKAYLSYLLVKAFEFLSLFSSIIRTIVRSLTNR